MLSYTIYKIFISLFFRVPLSDIMRTTRENRCHSLQPRIITSELLSNLICMNLTNTFSWNLSLLLCFIAFACDGACSMIDKDSGVATRLKILIDYISGAQRPAGGSHPACDESSCGPSCQTGNAIISRHSTNA